MNAVVKVGEVASDEELRSLVEQFAEAESYFFLRWPHKVSGFCRSLPPEFPSPEGQVFDRNTELRWKRQNQGYSLLLLSAEKELAKAIAQDIFTFDPDDRDCKWKICERNAHPYVPTETRFPRGFDSREIDSKAIKIGQRYFIDSQTSTIHFVALRLIEKP